MKKIIGAFLFIIFLLNVNWTTALVYEDNVKIDSNFSEFWLLEEYLKNHKNKILWFQEKYQIYDNQKINFLVYQIEDLEKIAGNIYKNKKIDYDRKLVWDQIVKKLKNINIQLKEILTYEKYKFEQNLNKKHKAYSQIWEEIWSSIYKKINQQIEIIKKSDLTTQNKLKIVIHLRNLEKNALYLKNFKNKNFTNQEDMKKSFTKVFQEIKKDLWEINNLLQK